MEERKRVRVGIIGSRRRDSLEDYVATKQAFKDLVEKRAISVNDIDIVSGGCPKGGDRFAEMIANSYGIPMIIHYPDQSKLPPNPKRYDFRVINYARNEIVAADSDIIIACVAPDRKGGTEHTIGVYHKLGKTDLILC